MAIYQQSFSVFSTYVEVILVRNPTEITSWSFLHVCGGDPCSPGAKYKLHRVFSTYVEVIPGMTKNAMKQAGFLHVCGGDPSTRVD